MAGEETDPPVALDLAEVRRRLAPRTRWSIEWRAECGSTSAVLMERARAGAADRSVLVAGRQTAGRGRRGAAWLAPPSASLAFSFLFETGRAPIAFGLLPLAAGVGCCRALRRLGADGVALKWPNDLVLFSGKLGGILVESSLRDSASPVVIGIGINLVEGDRLTQRLGRAVADLAQAGIRPGREELLAALLEEMETLLAAFEENRDDEIVVAWSGYDALRGRQIEVLGSGATVRGVARGIRLDGGLRVDTALGERVIYAGEASIR